MLLRFLACPALLVSLAALGPVTAGPFVPTSDSQILERLPFTANDPTVRELRIMHQGLKKQPENLPLALRLARGYMELGRTTGDPRYAGYAQAALAAWWELPNPPQEVLVLRAMLRQRVHQFDAALADLAVVLAADPRDAQSRLTRATVLEVIGEFDRAREDCLALRGLATELVWTACLDSVNAMTGRLNESYLQLRTTLERSAGAQPRIRSWASTSLGEMAARAGMASDAEKYFRQALAIDPTDNYLLAAFADFLLDQDRPREAADMLKEYTRVDPLLLRYAVALQALHSPELSTLIGQLRDRFEASRLRGDRVHLREEARFTLQLLNDPNAALALARENWGAQKEVADLRIWLEAAVAASAKADIETARGWLRATGLEDGRLAHLGEKIISPN
jgi:tetratricopeptide (TPR) repeat protein